MNLARHELGFSKTASRFPTRNLPRHLFPRRQRGTAARRGAARRVSLVRGMAAQLRDLFRLTSRPSRRKTFSITTTFCSTGQTVAEPALADDIGGRFDHVLVDEYQDTNRLQSSILLALKPRARSHGCRRRRPVDLFLPRGDVRNILDFPNAFSPPRHHHARTQLSLDAADPGAANGVIELARERFAKNLWTERQSAELPRIVSVRDEADQAATSPCACWKNGKRREPQTAGGAVSRVASQRPLELELTAATFLS